MKLIYATDVHGSFERVRELLRLVPADVYIVAGDLVDIPFYTVRTARRYHDLQTYFHSLRRDRGKMAASLDDFVATLLEEPDLPGEVWEKGARFRYETMRARQIFQKHYRLLENILSLAPVGRTFTLPGNHDMDLRQTRLRRRDLHLQCHETGGIRIAGYGGAAGNTPGIPERLGVAYREGPGGEGDEMYRFFASAQPHIVVVHQPPYGILDFAPPMGETGSHALRRYCDRHPVLLCLTGHLHDQWGLEEVEDTVYLNPSHFGEIVQENGTIAEGGFFHEVEIVNEKIGLVRHRKLAGGAIHDLAWYELREGAWLKVVVDRERYGALLRGVNCEPPEEA